MYYFVQCPNIFRTGSESNTQKVIHILYNIYNSTETDLSLGMNIGGYSQTHQNFIQSQNQLKLLHENDRTQKNQFESNLKTKPNHSNSFSFVSLLSFTLTFQLESTIFLINFLYFESIFFRYNLKINIFDFFIKRYLIDTNPT